MMPRCFILLGGQGTRLLPLTNWIHKAMIPLCGKPILEYIILNLRRHNIRDIVFCSNPRTAEQFTNYFGNGSRFGVKIRYSIGKQSLNTAGRILNAKNWIDDTFIVYYGDVLSDVNLLKVFDFHKSKDGIGTIVLSPMLPTAVGITKVGRDGRISEVKEKPLLSYPTNMGIYILEPKILRYIRSEYDFFRDLFPVLLQNGEKLYGYFSDREWLDVGTFRDLQRAEEFVKRNFKEVLEVEQDIVAHSNL